ncbi:hypothetical protein O181_052563 [Austropuccinia psidii MF-1]|uniref:Uncharacterized protein n=1 Tax=Austropuccinia psidii MF-1 TaxID=1389203 RepID=A0A9Q3E5Q9_9BASI|nr:hypothetical protein [Austropuccinia psidii MF-1]
MDAQTPNKQMGMLLDDFPVPSSITSPTPPPMRTLLLDRSKVIIQPMKHGNGERTFELGPTVTMSFHPWDSNTKVSIEQNPPNPPRQDSPVSHMPCKQTPRIPTPGPSGTQWLEDLFCSKKPPFPFSSSELNLPPFVQPSQHHEPPIPGASQPSKPHEDALTHESEPEVAPTQCMEESFACPATPTLVIIIDDMPVGSAPPPPLLPQVPPSAPKNPGAKLSSFPR